MPCEPRVSDLARDPPQGWAIAGVVDCIDSCSHTIVQDKDKQQRKRFPNQ